MVVGALFSAAGVTTWFSRDVYHNSAILSALQRDPIEKRSAQIVYVVVESSFQQDVCL